MNKSYRKEDIPTILDRETGKLVPIFGNNESVDAEHVDAAPTPLEVKLADALEALKTLQNKIKSYYKEVFPEENLDKTKSEIDFGCLIQAIADKAKKANNSKKPEAEPKQTKISTKKTPTRKTTAQKPKKK